ncbi:MarR family transcriptional regulator [Streptomyces cirratus]|uniref:MarR family transcriptional regulator n=1 Tax=Streptomyces cirratus TaxID=68187 RepID=A0ABQ3EY73_9ACTN|nr:MarR family transcriptional regulator [Streptomyces cirratus]GHB61004.1 MarR family transcriptional regulator [Streptomyces cirratus]
MPASGPPPDHLATAHALSTVSQLLDVLWARGQEAAATGAIPPSQLRALFVVEGNQGTNLRALGEALGSRPSAVSRLCDRLEAVGLLRRTASAHSAREIELHLTRAGRDTLDQIRAFRRSEVTDVLATMSPVQLAALANGLAAFEDAAGARTGFPRRDPGSPAAVAETA